MSFSLDYALEGAGWAGAIVRDGDAEVTMSVSYLHDSLNELVQAGVVLAGGGNTARVVFMDEPGEHHLNFSCSNDVATYEVRWYHHWFSWGEGKENENEIVLSGVATRNRVTGEILKVLNYLFEDHGLETYKRLWGEHEFPREKHLRLAALKNRPSQVQASR